MRIIPKENEEAQILANWLDLNKYTFSAIRNESDSHSFYKWKKRKAEWVRPWIPDFCIILKRWDLLFIELKRQRKILKSWKLWASPSIIRLEQTIWINKLEKLENISAQICYWAEESIKLIEEYERV